MNLLELNLSLAADIASIVMALAAVFLTYQAQRFARKSSKSNFIMSTTTMLNNINEFSISSPEHAASLLQLRPGVSDNIHKDYIALINLNYLHAIWSLREEKLVSSDLADAKLRNGVGFLLHSPDTYTDALLGRGFPPKFQEEIRRYCLDARSD